MIDNLINRIWPFYSNMCDNHSIPKTLFPFILYLILIAFDLRKKKPFRNFETIDKIWLVTEIFGAITALGLIFLEVLSYL